VTSTSTAGVGGVSRSVHKYGLGIARGSYWYLSNSVATGTADNVFPY
jgi:hypothetical protein